MKKTILIFIISYIFMIYYKITVYAKKYTINNNEESFQKMIDILHYMQNSDELILYFEDDYYDIYEFSVDYDILVTVSSNITIIGNNNGTVFDFNNERKGVFIFSHTEDKVKSVTFENIIFKNARSVDPSIDLVRFVSNTDKLFSTFNNCTFQNIFFNIIAIFSSCTKSNHEEASLLINNCKFM